MATGLAQAPAGATAAQLLQEQASALDEEARRHKRLADHHRRQAQLVRQRLDRLTAACQALGIKLVIAPGHSPKEGTVR